VASPRVRIEDVALSRVELTPMNRRRKFALA
jgi:hypothetical protein